MTANRRTETLPPPTCPHPVPIELSPAVDGSTPYPLPTIGTFVLFSVPRGQRGMPALEDAMAEPIPFPTPLPERVADVIARYHYEVAEARARAERRLCRLPEASDVDPAFVALRRGRASRRGRGRAPEAG